MSDPCKLERCSGRFIRQPIEERFWSHVDQRDDDECWPWTGGKYHFGHGQFWINCHKMSAHRMAYELTFHPIPEGMFVCHTCDNPPCCNPAHLFVGTQADNMQDKKNKGRSTQGERHAMAKLTEDQVRGIRSATGKQRDIAAAFGISQSQVNAIRSGRAWHHVK